MRLQLAVDLNESEQATLAALPPADQPAFTMAKLAAQLSSNLLHSLANGNVLSALQPADAQAIQTIIAAIKAMP